MKKRINKATELEQLTNCIIRLLFAGLVAVMIISASAIFLTGQTFMAGLALLFSSIILAALILGYKKIELFCKEFRLRFKS